MGVKVDMNEELKFCENSSKKNREGSGDQGGCERRIEVL